MIKENDSMNKNLFRSGFDGVTELDALHKAGKSSSGIYDFYVKDGDEALMRFLTYVPLGFNAHTIKVGKAPKTFLCTGDENCLGCKQPDSFDPSKPNKATTKAAFLVLDGREVERDEMVDGKPTGKKVTYTDQIRVMVRGVSDIAVIARVKNKYGLEGKAFYCSKQGQKNPYTFDRLDECPNGKDPLFWSNGPLSDEAIAKLREKLPEKYREMDFEDILMDLFTPFGAPQQEVEEPLGLQRL